jgi:hypothetical protein
MLLCFSDEISAAGGGIILIIALLIITAAVFVVKFALDIALNKKLFPHEHNEEKNYIYALKNEPKKRHHKSAAKYTIIPENKLFILENPSLKDNRR